MRKLFVLVLCAMMAFSVCAQAETLTGSAKGFGGVLTVEVTKDGDTITGVEITAQSETAAVAGGALEAIPAAIVEANSTDVDVVTGATVTSNAIIAAVVNALDPDAVPYEEPVAAVLADADAYFGLGIDTMGRIGPGKDATETSVYSFNAVIVSALFDADGRILDIYMDQIEIATPNYDGEGMPHFSGFPGQGGYNWDENHDGTIAGKTEDTEESFLAEVANWSTKRERGDGYHMNTGSWRTQADGFQGLFIGKTVEEIEEWFGAYTSDRNGRPLKAGSENEQDAAKYDALSDEEKAMLADVTTTATMSLNDSHGNILAAIAKAFENRVPLHVELAK